MIAGFEVIFGFEVTSLVVVAVVLCVFGLDVGFVAMFTTAFGFGVVGLGLGLSLNGAGFLLAARGKKDTI